MPTGESDRVLLHEWIASHTPAGGRVLDIGCGKGDLLARLVEEKQVRATGLELSEACVFRAIQRGLSVHHGDAEEGLDHYGSASFDLVILSLTIQELGDLRKVLRESLRVGRQVAVVFPNFAHWRARLQLAVEGRTPHTELLPGLWYESPNRHYLTVRDWAEFCRTEGWRILDCAFLAAGRRIRVLPNLRAEAAMYLLEGTRG